MAVSHMNLMSWKRKLLCAISMQQIHGHVVIMWQLIKNSYTAKTELQRLYEGWKGRDLRYLLMVFRDCLLYTSPSPRD